MRIINEYTRSFFVSLEMLVWVVGLGVLVFTQNQIDAAITEWKPTESKAMWFLSVPTIITGWVLSSWRKILFQDSDKKYLLQQWPDYWKLEIILTCAVVHAVLFFIVAVAAVVFPPWSPPPPWAIVSLICSYIGLMIDGFTCYKADIELAKAVRKFTANRA